MMKLKQLRNSFGHALRGLSVAFRSEQSFRLQTIAACFVIALAMWLRIKQNELIVILLLVASVLILELLNSIIERLVDALKPRIHPMVKEVKDMMASAVLLMSIFACVIGVLIFYPYLSLLVLR